MYRNPGNDAAEPEFDAARERLARALRHLNELLVISDETTLGTAAVVNEAEQLEAACARIEAVGVRLLPRPTVEPDAPAVRRGWMGSAVSGAGNAIAPPLVNDAKVDGVHHARLVFGAAYSGTAGNAHGGTVACVFDEFLARALGDAGVQAMTGTLTLRYRHPTPLYRELQVTAWLDRVEGRKVISRGELRDGDILCVEAEAIFVTRSYEEVKQRSLERDGIVVE